MDQSVGVDLFEKALESMTTVKQVREAFKAMKTFFSASQMGYKCFAVAEKLFELKAFRRVLKYGTRALKAFTRNHDNSRDSYFRIVNALFLLAKSSYNLKNYEKSLYYLTRVYTHLHDLLHDEDNQIRSVFELLIDVHVNLYTVKDAMGDREEAVYHALNVLDIRDKTLQDDGVTLGDANMGVSDAYLRGFGHQLALPFCLNALKIYEEVLGTDSLQAAGAKRSLAVIYQGMGEFNKSLEFNRSAASVLKDRVPAGSPETLIVEVEGAYTMIQLGQYDDAVEAMKTVVARDDMQGWLRVNSFLTMARALCYLRRFDEAKGYMSVPRTMLERKEIDDPVLVSVGYSDLSSMYAMMNDLETAIAMLKTGLAYSKLPQKLLVQLCEAVMLLISISSEEKGEFPYMVNEVQNLKENFGQEHCVVGFGYSNLGDAYMKSGKYELCAESLVNAKTILDATLGQHHLISLKTSHILSVAYDALERYYEAVKIEERVVKSLEGMVPREEMFLNQAVEHLSKMQKRVTESPARASTSQSIDEEDLAPKISDAGISDE